MVICKVETVTLPLTYYFIIIKFQIFCFINFDLN